MGIACFKKEWLEHCRSSRITILGILFILFGIMNPAIAKLTPMLLEALSDSLEAGGIQITQVTVTDMDSWVQFYKNIPMALIAFVLLEAGIFTKEYQSGTLILTLTKGLPRYQVVLSKSLMTVLLWSAGYWLCYGITYAYNDYYWDNGVAQNLAAAAIYWWVFGLWVISLLIFFSTVFSASSGVLLGTGSVVVAAWLLSIIPKAAPYLPTALTGGSSMLQPGAETDIYPLLITLSLFVISILASIFTFNKKQL